MDAADSLAVAKPRMRAWIVAAVLVLSGIALPIGHYLFGYAPENAAFQVALDNNAASVRQQEFHLSVADSALTQGDLKTARIFIDAAHAQKASSDPLLVEAYTRLEPVTRQLAAFLLLGGLAAMAGLIVVAVSMRGAAARGLLSCGLGAVFGLAACLGVLVTTDAFPMPFMRLTGIGTVNNRNHFTDAGYFYWFLVYAVVAAFAVAVTRRLAHGPSGLRVQTTRRNHPRARSAKSRAKHDPG